MYHAPPPPISLSHFAYPLFLIFPEYLLYQDKLKTMLMHIFGGANQGVLWKMCTGEWMHSKRCTTTSEYANWGYQTVGRWRVTTTWEHTSPITNFLFTLHLLNVTFFSFILRKSWRSTMSSRLDNGPLALFRALILTDLLLVLFFGRKDGL